MQHTHTRMKLNQKDDAASCYIISENKKNLFDADCRMPPACMILLYYFFLGWGAYV
jgi:hypothetical protein